MVRQPQASLPQQSGSWAATLGAYRLLHNERVEPAMIQQPAIEQTRQQCRASGVVLAVHDLTELDPVYELTASRHYQHTALAIDPQRGPLGLLHQHWFEDPKRQPGETAGQRRCRFRRSQSWAKAIAAIGASGDGLRVIHVADREADDFQTLHACLQQTQGFVIRSQHDRYLTNGQRLRAFMSQQPVAAGMYVAVARRSAVADKAPPKRHRRAQPPRLAKLLIRHARVELAPPRTDPRYRQPLVVHAVWAQEIDPPPGVEQPIDWLLLTSESVNSAADALRIIGYYAQRWLIEEFHKAQKTGCRLEASQLQDRHAFERLAAIAAVVAVRLLQLRQAADDSATAEQPAEQHVPPLAVQILALLTGHRQPQSMTVHEFYRSLAKLGGHLGRKHDGRPGWQTLWRGWEKLADCLTGINLFRQLQSQRGCV